MLRIATSILSLIATLCTALLSQEPSASLAHCPVKFPDFVEPDDMVRPKYPKDALQVGIEGVVELEAVVSADGKTRDLRLVTGSPALTKVSLEAVRKWRFHPVLIKSEPAETIYRVKFNFSLLLQEAVPHVELESPAPVDRTTPVPVPGITSAIEDPSSRVAGSAGVWTLPKVTHQVNPEFSEEARKAKESGNVEIDLTVGQDGLPHDLQPACADWPSLTEKAVEAVSQWRFQPATDVGKPVESRVRVIVEFHLYD